MSVYLARLARLCFRRRRAVLGIWLLVIIGVIAVAQLSGGKTVDDFSVPGTSAQKASDQLKSRLPDYAGASTQVVYEAKGGGSLNDSGTKKAIENVVTTLKNTPQVSSVTDPYKTNNVSKDGKAAIVQVQYKVDDKDVKDSTLDTVKKGGDAAKSKSVAVDYGGQIYPGSRTTPSELPEIIGIGLGFLIMVITFGAFIAAGIPLFTALCGLILGLMGVTAVASVVSVATASTSLAIMLSLACGLDYALFILVRHRNNLLVGMSVEDSVALAAGTAGSSVVFAALTVIIALCGLSVVGIPFLTVMGLAAAGSVLIALLVALTLLPAMLGFAGPKVTNFFGLKRRDRTKKVAYTAALEPERTFGARWARLVVRRKVLFIVGGVLGLLVIAIPALDLQLGLPSGASKPTSDTGRRAYDQITDHFGAGANGVLLVVVDLNNQKSSSAAQTVATSLGKESDVASSVLTTTQNKTALIRVTPKSGPNNTKTADLVKKIRNDAPSLESQTGTNILVGGTTATNIDTSQKLSSALPVFVIVVAGLAFVLLTFAFRTILVPIKSIIGFLLSAVAAFGAEVAVFQWGWLHNLLGVQPGETLSFLPTIMIAIIFGLSSDYEVFVVSRIKEDFTRTGDAVGAVERGTGQAARVVTAAALIMFSVFACFFLFNTDSTVKAIGFGLGVGVFLDAFVVRMTLVPAVMALIKTKFWYHPEWFEKYVPDLDIEGEKLEKALSAEAAPQPATLG